ncbi:hypothetical protein Pmani_034058 [Petrolisthes manimaculis]|uniref:Major facilitator superfamily (MFS) profile domain-containing protein n=1 Tax=Petrolisthes manimaculis TaxID=1843537 RepID=A0AAE1TS00_9EUCA|nr:hypothetical protein Pmani_034058 [Petrolisthes manimaculis]
MAGTRKRDPCSRVPARLALSFLTSAGVVVLYILRINLSVAIVAMVDLAPTPSNNNNINNINNNINNNHTSTFTNNNNINNNHTSTFTNNNNNNNNNHTSTFTKNINNNNDVAFCTAIVKVNEWDEARSSGGQQEGHLTHLNINDTHLTHLNINVTSTPQPDEGDGSFKMVLTSTQRGLVLGAFFYGYALTNIPGGRLAEMYGTKIVFGGAILIGGVLTLFIPLAARAHYIVLVVLRALLGLSNGVVYPAMNVMVVRWIPPLERSRFMSITFMSNTLGTIVTMPVCGFLIAWVGWPSVFYFSGAVSLLWVLMWGLLMHDTPLQHPRISPQERDYIMEALNAESKKEKPSRTPWRSIMTSLPVWATTFAQIGSMFGFNLLLTQLPTYLATILGFTITDFVGSVSFGFLSDWLLTHQYISVKTSRKLFCTISHVLPGIMLLLVGYSGCNSVLAMTLFCLSAGFSGCIWSGHLANHFDLSPNFTGTLMGVSNTIAFLVSICVPIIVGAMTPDQGQGQSANNPPTNQPLPFIPHSSVPKEQKCVAAAHPDNPTTQMPTSSMPHTVI